MRRAASWERNAHVTFCGHIHRPALYSMSAVAKMTSFRADRRPSPVQLLAGRRWLAVLGFGGAALATAIRRPRFAMF